MSNLAEKTVQLTGGINPNVVATVTHLYSHQDFDSNYEVVSFDEGEFIIKENETPKGLYVLKTGCVKLYVNRDNSRGRTTSPEYVTKLVSPGEVFGYKAIVQGLQSQTFAKAVKKTTVWIYPKESIVKLFNQMNPIMKTMLEQSVSDIQNFERTNQFHYLASVQERIAFQLVSLSDRFGIKTPRGTSLNLKLTRNEFAQLASTINESLSRHLTEFKSEGLIDLNGKEIIILDREKLIEKSGHF
jgi:CRP-like cAMP-binding protein